MKNKNNKKGNTMTSDTQKDIGKLYNQYKASKLNLNELVKAIDNLWTKAGINNNENMLFSEIFNSGLYHVKFSQSGVDIS